LSYGVLQKWKYQKAKENKMSKKNKKNQQNVVTFRVNKTENDLIVESAKAHGFQTVSEYLRSLCLADGEQASKQTPQTEALTKLKEQSETLGALSKQMNSIQDQMLSIEKNSNTRDLLLDLLGRISDIESRFSKLEIATRGLFINTANIRGFAVEFTNAQEPELSQRLRAQMKHFGDEQKDYFFGIYPDQRPKN
jgi:hypothetical protein